MDYIKIRNKYCPPQAGKFSNDLLAKYLEAKGYYQAKTIQGLWRYKTRQIIFYMVVDNFDI